MGRVGSVNSRVNFPQMPFSCLCEDFHAETVGQHLERTGQANARCPECDQMALARRNTARVTSGAALILKRSAALPTPRFT
jgi:hypothetical protein